MRSRFAVRARDRFDKGYPQFESLRHAHVISAAFEWRGVVFDVVGDARPAIPRFLVVVAVAKFLSVTAAVVVAVVLRDLLVSTREEVQEAVAR